MNINMVRQLRRIRCFKNTAPYLVYVNSNYFSLDIQHYLPSKLCASGVIFPTAMTKPVLVFALIVRDFSKTVAVEGLQLKLRYLTNANQYREPSI
jgi:hypothetical protein